MQAFAEENLGQKIQSGHASWYGPGFHGRRTANGERFNTNELTAAHRSLPFGTRVRVVNLKTGRSVVVRINDRGPFIRGRIIDLARSAAQQIGMGGVATVSLYRLG
jgi:rare lipoprotein A